VKKKGSERLSKIKRRIPSVKKLWSAQPGKPSRKDERRQYSAVKKGAEKKDSSQTMQQDKRRSGTKGGDH